MYYAGDTDTNTGVIVSAILKNPSISTPAKYAFLYTEQGPYMDYLQAWIDVTGRRTTYVEVSQEQYEALWGKEFGEEMALMFKAFEKEGDWGKAHKPDVVTPKDLGIKEGEMVGLKATLEREKHRL